MKKLILILFTTFLITNCENKQSDNFHPEIMKPNWDGIKTENLKFKIGDIVSIYFAKNFYTGVVMDFDQDESGIWYGLCLSNYRGLAPNQKNIKELDFFGRKIPNGLTGKFIDCYDLTYLNEKSINEKNITIYDNIKLDINKISIGAISPAIDIKQLEDNFFNSFKSRNQKRVENKKVIEQYFKITNSLKE